jgi:hypothetical protein
MSFADRWSFFHESEAMNQFALLQEEYVALDPSRVAPLYQKTLGMVRYDAVHLARQGRGLLVEDLSAAQAQALQAALAQAGYPTEVIAQEHVIRLGKAQRVRQLDIADHGLTVSFGYHEETEVLPWEGILLLAAGEIVKIEVQQKTQPGRRPRFSGLLGMGALVSPLAFKAYMVAAKAYQDATARPVSTERRAVTHQLADVFATTRAGEYRHLRLNSRDLLYESILGAERLDQYRDNFRLVLAKLGTRAQQAMISPETQALVAGPDAAANSSDPYFGEEAEFDHYNRWLLQRLLLARLNPEEPR